VKLRFTPRAVQDVAELADFVRQRNPDAAERVRAAIYEGLRNLLLFPYAGREQNTASVRKLVTRKFSYLIYYTVDAEAEEIIVLNVKHPARERNHSDA
jgi:addiction module RelE/StbE family toxin